MKKTALATLLGLTLLAGSLGLFSRNGTEAKPDSSLPVIPNAKTMDLKTVMTVSTKDGAPNKEAILAKATSLAVPFVKNVGQFDSQVKYAADLFNGRFFLTDNELVYSLVKHAKQNTGRQNKRKLETGPDEKMPGKGLAFKEYFVDKNGTKINFKSTGEQQAATKVSYFKGNDPSKWHSGVASYQGVSLGEVYPGVEVKLKASGKNVEKIFYVSPQADVAQIKIGVAGITGLEIASDGRLLFKNRLGELAMRAPIAWQQIDGQRQEVKVNYRSLGKKQYGLAVPGDYDKKYALVIDPELDTLLASTLLIGDRDDEGHSIALDKFGNVYLAGNTRSIYFTTSGSAYDRTYNGDYYEDYGDVVLAKLDSNLTTLLASTYLGGNEFDILKSLALDDSGNVYVSGQTSSSNFPTTAYAYQQYFNGRNGSIDVFISKLDGSLSKLLASSFLGGGNIGGNSLALDSSGNVYLAAYGGGATVSKLNSELSSLLASISFGGSSDDTAESLALDNMGSVFVCGHTTSVDFPTTPGAFDRQYNGGRDIFLTKLDGNLTTFLASTYLGGSSREWNSFLALDRYGNVYVTADTDSLDFPTTRGAYARTHKGGNNDVVVSRLNSQLTTLLASTFLGGSMGEYARALALDPAGNIYVTGPTGSSDFPTTAGVFDQTYNGGNCDAFVAKLDGRLTTVLSSTFLGGSDFDSSYSLALDNIGDIYLTGKTYPPNFPTTPGAYNRAYYSFLNQGDIFISKLNSGLNKNNITVTSPKGGESWRVGTAQDITWAHFGPIGNVKIEISTDNGSVWSEVGNATTNGEIFHWVVPNTISLHCLIRISDTSNPAWTDTSDALFSIIMDIDLIAERREVKSFSNMKQYGQIDFLITHPEVPVAECRILRSKGNEDFVLLKSVLPSELQNNQFQMQDKYLEKNIQCTYRVEAYNAAGQLVGRSAEKTI